MARMCVNLFNCASNEAYVGSKVINVPKKNNIQGEVISQGKIIR